MVCAWSAEVAAGGEGRVSVGWEWNGGEGGEEARGAPWAYLRSAASSLEGHFISRMEIAGSARRLQLRLFTGEIHIVRRVYVGQTMHVRQHGAVSLHMQRMYVYMEQYI